MKATEKLGDFIFHLQGYQLMDSMLNVRGKRKGIRGEALSDQDSPYRDRID